VRSRYPRGLGLAILAVLAVTLPACHHASLRLAHLPEPSAGAATTVPGQPPVVWVSGQTAVVTSNRVNVVEGPGSRLSIRRLAEGATKFFRQDSDRWVLMSPDDIQLIDVGTPVCVESLLDRSHYLALRVFVGAACGPRP
jgi:hypothetical protein